MRVSFSRSRTWWWSPVFAPQQACCSVLHGSHWRGMGTLVRPRGMVDLMGSECAEFAWVERQARTAAVLHGLEEIRTPIVEQTCTFQRSLGEGSDVVSKEMYSFLDRSGNSLTLRPEGTAGVGRAMFSSHAEWAGSGRKVFYCGPMFRYERPQKGRQRQFTQFGVELMGFDGHSADVNAVEIGKDFLDRIGLTSKTALMINTLGDDESRSRYSSVLFEYFSKYESHLSGDSQRRLASGRVLRILDSKEPGDQTFISDAPKPDKTLSKDAALRFDKVLNSLDKLGISYQVDPRLVRGLDYYSHTIFEFVVGTNQQSDERPIAVLAGGRYDGLASTLGFKSAVPAVGWAAGIERLCMERERLGLNLTRESEFPNRIFVLPLLERENPQDNEAICGHSLRLTSYIRSLGIPTQTWFQQFDMPEVTGNQIKKGFRQAERSNCNFIAIVGKAEAEKGDLAAAIKNLATGKQIGVQTAEDVLKYFTEQSQ